MVVAWLTLLAAGCFEVAWAVGLASTRGFTRPWPTAWVVAAMLLSFVLLARAARTIPGPIAYTAWVGFGVAGTWLVSVAFMRQPLRPVQLLFVVLVLCGVAGLKATTRPPTAPAETR